MTEVKVGAIVYTACAVADLLNRALTGRIPGWKPDTMSAGVDVRYEKRERNEDGTGSRDFLVWVHPVTWPDTSYIWLRLLPAARFRKCWDVEEGSVMAMHITPIEERKQSPFSVSFEADIWGGPVRLRAKGNDPMGELFNNAFDAFAEE